MNPIKHRSVGKSESNFMFGLKDAELSKKLQEKYGNSNLSEFDNKINQNKCN